MDELVDVANSFVELLAPDQPSDRVAERLNERTLRYYITKGLVDRPIGKEGSAVLYGYRHLLQLLALKRLQASYLPIKRIKDLLSGKTNNELMRFLTSEPGEHISDVRNTALSYLESLLPEGHGTRDSRRRRSEYEDRGPQDHLPSKQSQQRSRPSTLRNPIPASWKRFVLDDGIELHIRSDRIGTLRGSEVKRTVERILNLLRREHRPEKEQ
jgi:DNA-binding transcriptional MerR regulator